MAKQTKATAVDTATAGYKMTIEEIRLKIETEKKLAAQAIAKANASHKDALDALTKSKDKLENQLSELDEKFEVESVTIVAEIEKLEAAKLEKEEALATRTAEIEEKLHDKEVEFAKALSAKEMEFKDYLSRLTEIHKRNIEIAGYENEKQIREKGEGAFAKYLADRDMVAVKSFEFNDLKAYKASSEIELNEKIAKAVEIAKAEAVSEFNHQKAIDDLNHKNEIVLLNKEIAHLQEQLKKAYAFKSDIKEHESNLVDGIGKIVAAASKTVENHVNQNTGK
jgi:hypothetical protein